MKNRYSETEQTERSEEYYWTGEREHHFKESSRFGFEDEQERRQRLEEREKQRKEFLQKELRKQELLERERERHDLLEKQNRAEELHREELRQQELIEKERRQEEERRWQETLEREEREKLRRQQEQEAEEAEARERRRQQEEQLRKEAEEREKRQKEILEREVLEKERRQQELRERERRNEELRRQEREERQRYFQEQRENKLYEETVQQQQEEQQQPRFQPRRDLGSVDGNDSQNHVDPNYRYRQYQMPVDYSPTDFQQSLAAIDAASRDGVRVSRQGDTTILTEHRDPYSFYWQLDQARRQENEPVRPPPPTDYVIDEETVAETVLSPDSHDSGINIERENVESQYSRPIRVEEPPPMKRLPAGWEKHQDPSGYSYYWHVDSGTIQREPPHSEPHLQPSSGSPAHAQQPTRVPVQVQSREIQVDVPSPAPPPPASPPVQQIIQMPPQQPVIEEHAFKQTTTKRRVENDAQSDGDFDDDDVVGKNIVIDAGISGSDENGGGSTSFVGVILYLKNCLMPVRFAVRSLGWTEIPEEDLTAERSSRAVNKAIVDLSTGRNDIMDNVSKWGDGRELIMELDDNDLTLIDPDTMSVVHSERIQQIRVWGVGRDNGRNRGLVLPERWILADVAIAPSTITISAVNGNQIAQCRVRYLSFLGIGRDVKHCAFIMHTSSENFMCYVFHVEPSAGTMAKTIEAACKLRYQKVLDAHSNGRIPPHGKDWGESLWDTIGSLRSRFLPR
uniref:WW domain-containing protein n=1 Tax=Syphacia muris TaxID=451379 RepID=A0A0N5AZA8_9BILA